MVVPLNLLTLSIITRTLGPELYGEYRYLIYFFTLVSSFVGFGGNYFNTELAKDHYNQKLILFYKNYLLINWVFVTLLLCIVSFTGFKETVFPGSIESAYIWLAFLVAFLTYVSQFMESMTDSCGLTKNASIFNFIAKFAGVVILILFVYVMKWTDLTSFFWYSIFVVALTIIGFGYVLKRNEIPIEGLRISGADFKQNFRSFFSYSHPLLVLSIFTFLAGFLSRWVLQFFGGAIQQGYFSLSDSFSAFIIIFSNSITPLLQREFAISFSNQDMPKMKALFHRSLLIFTGVSSFLSLFIILYAEYFTLIIGGNSFKDAVIPTQIMLFYPIPYIANNILYATIYAVGKTRVLRNVQITICLLNLVITCFLVAPSAYFGLGLGAIGFAISMVAVTYLNHFILLKYCAEMFELKSFKIVADYFKIVLSFTVVGLSAYFLIGILHLNPILTVLISGIIYTIGSLLLFMNYPALIGFSKNEIQFLIQGIKNPSTLFKKN